MDQLIPWAIFCLVILVLCLMRPRVGRIFVGIFFIVMAVGVNIVLVFLAPEQFVALGADSFVPLYRWGFRNVVALAPPVFGFIVAIFEIVIGFLLLRKGPATKWGLIGGILFLTAITPLGIWTLPNVIMAIALGYLLAKEYDRNFWGMLGNARKV